MNRELRKHSGRALSRAINSASCFRSGGESQGVSVHTCTSRLPRQRSIAIPSCHRSLPIWPFQGQSESQTPSESRPSAGMSRM